MYKWWKIGKYTFQSCSVDRRGQWWQGSVWQTEHTVWSWNRTVPSWGGHRDPAQGSGGRARGWAPKLLLPKNPPAMRSLPKETGKRDFSFLNHSEMSQLIFPSVIPEQNQWCPGSSRKILPNIHLQGLGTDFFPLSSVVKNIHSPQWDPLLNKGPFSMRSCRIPPAPNSSISALPWFCPRPWWLRSHFSKSPNQETKRSLLTMWAEAPEVRNHICAQGNDSPQDSSRENPQGRSSWLLWALSTERCSLELQQAPSSLGNARA